MTFEIEIAGRTRTVTVEALGAGADGGRFRVRVDGELSEVDARVTDLGLSLVYEIDGRGVDVAVTDRPGGELMLQLPHVLVPAVVDGRRFRRGGSASVASAGEHRVVAPMPGRIVRVLVAAGQDVAARQGLVVVEAMKMENEIASPKAGRVKEVAVREGESVEAGRLLTVVE
jgi:biotin carboxyl carrier protein